MSGLEAGLARLRLAAQALDKDETDDKLLDELRAAGDHMSVILYAPTSPIDNEVVLEYSKRACYAVGPKKCGMYLCRSGPSRGKRPKFARHELLVCEWVMMERNVKWTEELLVDGRGMDGLQGSRVLLSSRKKPADIRLRWALGADGENFAKSETARAISKGLALSSLVGLAFSKHELFDQFQSMLCDAIQDHRSKTNNFIDAAGLCLQNQVQLETVKKRLLVKKQGESAADVIARRMTEACDAVRAGLLKGGPTDNEINVVTKLCAMTCNALVAGNRYSLKWRRALCEAHVYRALVGLLKASDESRVVLSAETQRVSYHALSEITRASAVDILSSTALKKDDDDERVGCSCAFSVFLDDASSEEAWPQPRLAALFKRLTAEASPKVEKQNKKKKQPTVKVFVPADRGALVEAVMRLDAAAIRSDFLYLAAAARNHPDFVVRARTNDSLFSIRARVRSQSQQGEMADLLKFSPTLAACASTFDPNRAVLELTQKAIALVQDLATQRRHASWQNVDQTPETAKETHAKLLAEHLRPTTKREFHSCLNVPEMAVKDNRRIKCSNKTCERREEKNIVQFARCSRCRAAAYCSPQCQKQHWPTHKLSCGKKG